MKQQEQTCPLCGEKLVLSGPLMQVPICPVCTAKHVKLPQGTRKKTYVATQYHTQKTMDTPEVRQPSEQQLVDADLDAKTKAQHRQCIHCAYSCIIAGALFCDYISHKGHSKEKGGRPGDCRSFLSKEDVKKISKRHPPMLYK